MRPDASLDRRYFDGVFAGDDDPWSLANSPYEAAKFDRTIATIADRRYPRAIEVGCAHGVLTRRLALMCDDLLAIDISPRAIDLARARCAGLRGLRFATMAFPGDTPADGSLDLAIVSEVAYYWNDADLARAATWLGSHVAPGGRILLVHWTGDTDYPQTGDGATDTLFAALAGRVSIERAERHDGYRLDLWRRG